MAFRRVARLPGSKVPIAAALAGVLLLSAGAHASLGGAYASVGVDRARMGAQMSSVGMGTYTRHVLTRANGGTVRELTNADGAVFAVTWSGPGKPDLRSLLGDRFETFQNAGAATGRAMHSLRRPTQVDQSDLQIETEGHMGWFRGVAFVRSLAPAGFSTSDLAQEP